MHSAARCCYIIGLLPRSSHNAMRASKLDMKMVPALCRDSVLLEYWSCMANMMEISGESMKWFYLQQAAEVRLHCRQSTAVHDLSARECRHTICHTYCGDNLM
jgi:hypothetical protein